MSRHSVGPSRGLAVTAAWVLLALAPAPDARARSGAGGGAISTVGSTAARVEVPETRPNSRAFSQPETYGVPAVSHTIQAFAFLPLTSTTAYTAVGLGGGLACAGLSCFFEAPVFLPAGAVVRSIELEMCDTDAANDVNASVIQVGSPGGAVVNISQAASAGTPGCVFISGSPVSHEIDNVNSTYFAQVGLGPSSSTKFLAVRLFYSLQVSPGPGAATFTDVPIGHPFFKFVEALVDAGITAGCGGGLFCVDTPISRGQMAVFLSVALGLHFAP